MDTDREDLKLGILDSRTTHDSVIKVFGREPIELFAASVFIWVHPWLN